MTVISEFITEGSSDPTGSAGSASGRLDKLADEVAELRTMNDLLMATVRGLNSSNEELTASNQELTATVRGLSSSNEELTATVRGLSSSNQELTATMNRMMAATRIAVPPESAGGGCGGCDDGYAPAASTIAPGQLSYGFGGCGGDLSVHLPEGAGVHIGRHFFVDASGNISSVQLVDLERRVQRCTDAISAMGGA